jgi:hypothetical protein
VQNNATCGHQDTDTCWEVTWTIDDPHGMQHEALTGGCVKVAFTMQITADFGVGSDCFEAECPEDLLNYLHVLGPSYVNDIQLIFVDPQNPLNQAVVEPSSITIGNAYPWTAYYFDDEWYCNLETYGEDNSAWVSGEVTTTAATFECMRLKYVKVVGDALVYRFDKYGNPDLVMSEAISPLAGAGYSVRLYRLVYDRCNP